MVEVWTRMVDGRWLVMPRHTQPEPDVQALLNQTRITLPSQPPPPTKASQIPPRQVAAPLLCGEDSWVALTDPERFSSRQTLELRRSGRSEERRVGKECRSRWSP